MLLSGTYKGRIWGSVLLTEQDEYSQVWSSFMYKSVQPDWTGVLISFYSTADCLAWVSMPYSEQVWLLDMVTNTILRTTSVGWLQQAVHVFFVWRGAETEGMSMSPLAWIENSSKIVSCYTMSQAGQYMSDGFWCAHHTFNRSLMLIRLTNGLIVHRGVDCLLFGHLL